jgi:hypothetical protein
MEFDFPGFVKAFLAPAVVAAVVSWVFQLLAKGKVDSYFNQKLEQFKHDLGQVAAAAQFDYQRRLQDFNLFTERRNSVYAEMIGRLEGAFESLVENFGTRPKFVARATADYTDVPDEVLHQKLLMLGIKSKRMRASTIRTLRASPENIGKKLVTGLDLYYRKKSIDSVEAARNCLLSNSIFIDEAIYEEAQSYIAGAFDMLEKNSPSPENFLELRDKLGRIREHMRRHITAGDYSVATAVSTITATTEMKR